MSQPKRWWIGLIPLGLIWAAANYVETPRIEQDIAKRAREIVAAAPPELTRSEIKVEGRDVAFTGEAVQPGAAQGVTTAAHALAGTRLVYADVAPAQKQTPYTFAATREGQAVSLTGFVPSTQIRDSILAAARAALPGAVVTEQLKLASGAPPQFAPLAQHGVQQVARLSRGKFGLSDMTYSLEGVAANSASYDALSAIGNALPAGAKAGTIAITAPAVNPYTFEAKRDGGTLVLSGYVPDKATRDRIVAAAQAANPGLKIDDKLVYGAGAPQGFEAMATHAAGLAGKLVNGQAALSNATYSVTGAAADAAGYEAALAAVKALPAGASAGKIDILAPELKPYAFGLRRLENGTIVIEGAVPDAATRAALLAQAAKLYPGAKVEDRTQIARTAPAGFAAAAALAMEHLGKLKGGAISLTDGALSLSGEAANQAGADAIAKAFASLPGGFKLASNSVQVAIPEIKPYAFGLRRLADGSIVIEGAVPDAATRAALLAQAAKLYPGAKVEDRTQIARTAPAGFAAAAAFAMENVGKLKAGAISLSDGTLAISGEAVDKAAADAIARAFASLPGGFKLAGAAVQVPVPEIKPYAFSLRRLDDGTIVIDGAVPDAATRAALLAQAAKLYPGAKIEDRTQIARTAPAGFAAGTGLAMEHLGRLKGGVFAFSDGALTITGEAVDRAAADAIAKAFSALAGGFRVATNNLSLPAPKAPPAPPQPEAPKADMAASAAPAAPVTPEPPPTEPARTEPARTEPPRAAPARAEPAAQPPKATVNCSPGSGSIATGTVYFAEGGRDIASSEEAAIRKVLDALQSCRGARVYIVGHTNSHGNRIMNISLSSLRTFAASLWLQGNGIPKRRIETMGYGEDRPLAPETTPDMVAKNRRVEFTVR